MATFGTFISGQVLTAAELNTAGEFQSYTPTWTQSATITKTVNWARYTQLNKLVIGSVKMTASSAGTANNVIKVGLPVNASTNNYLVGSMTYFDQSTNSSIVIFVQALFDSASTMSFFPYNTPNANVVAVNTSSGAQNARFGQNFTPGDGGAALTGITVASNDIIYCQFMYEAA
jgi:hypothetical protein